MSNTFTTQSPVLVSNTVCILPLGLKSSIHEAVQHCVEYRDTAQGLDHDMNFGSEFSLPHVRSEITFGGEGGRQPGRDSSSRGQDVTAALPWRRPAATARVHPSALYWNLRTRVLGAGWLAGLRRRGFPGEGVQTHVPGCNNYIPRGDTDNKGRMWEKKK